MAANKTAEFKLKKFKMDIEVTKIANIHYFELIKDYHTFKDSHPFRELIYIDSGTIRVEADGFSGMLFEKQLLIHKSNEIHSLSCTENTAPNVIIIGFACDSPMLDIFSTNPQTLSAGLSKLLTEVIKEGRFVFYPPYDIPNVKDMKKRKTFLFGADQMIKLKLETFLIELIRSTKSALCADSTVRSDIKTEEIATYISNNYNQKITLDDLCFLFGTNKTTLCKKFREIYGETLINYLNNLRINHAKKLLRESNMSITQIANAVGFESIHYFSKTFKKIVNKTPSGYISSIKSKLDS